MTTVAEQFAEILAAAGVKGIYGIVGNSLNGLTDAIRKQGKIEWLHVNRYSGGWPRQPWPLCDLPNGRGRGAAADVRGNPDVDLPVAGTTRVAMMSAGVRCNR